MSHSWCPYISEHRIHSLEGCCYLGPDSFFVGPKSECFVTFDCTSFGNLTVQVHDNELYQGIPPAIHNN